MSRAYVQLGRTGDILNVLPMLWADSQAGHRSTIVVAKQFATVLDGVTYCDKLVFPGEPHDVAGAVALAERQGLIWTCTQVNCPVDIAREYVYGPAGLERAVTTSFLKEQWRVAGRLSEFGAHPLVFDARDTHREEELYNQYVTKGKYIAVCADGVSSPFRYRKLLLELVRHCGYSVVDLAEVKAERFYDLLGILEGASALVAIDSAPLHLAYAVPTLPVFALVNDQPLLWNGSSWRAQHEWYCRYQDFPDRAPELVAGLRSLRKTRGPVKVHHLWMGLRNTRELEPLPGWKPLEITKGMCARMGPAVQPEWPYLRDALRMALQRVGDDQILCVSGPTVEFVRVPDAEQIPCFAYRMVKGENGNQFAPIADAFFATGKWWREQLPNVPDLLFSNDYYWRHALWVLFQKNGGWDQTGIIETPPRKPRPWTVSTSEAHNSPLVAELVGKNGIYSRFPKVIDQVPQVGFSIEPLDDGLNAYGYNPSIAVWKGRRLLAYRYHPGQGPETKVALAELGPVGDIMTNYTLDIPGSSVEDPKLFEVNGELWMSYVESTLPNKDPKSVVKFGKLVDGRLSSTLQPSIGKNDFSAMEKNWVFWESDDGLCCLYETSPTQRIFLHDRWRETAGPRWAYGSIKGGTAPVPYKGNLLRFFHSTQDNEFGRWRRRYYLGAYLMAPTPPFEVLKVCERPLLWGSEMDHLRVKDRPHHFKPNVIFPGGVYQDGEDVVVSLGVNDCSCLLVRMTPKLWI